MPNPPLSAYTGTDPYVFISYAHRDSDDVYPLIRALASTGVPVWYDEGIEAGNEWAQKVADSLEKAHLCLLFATPTSVTRDNVLREVIYAEEHAIPVVVCRLGLDELSGNFAAHLKGAESFDIKNCRTYGDFVNKLKQPLEAAGVASAASTPASVAHGAPDAGAPRLLRKKIRLRETKRRGRGIAIPAVILAVLGVMALLAYKLLFPEVPAVVGENAADGVSLVEQAGFVCTVGVDYSDEYPYGVIFSQDREGRTLRLFPVVLTQSLGPERDLVAVPGVVGDEISVGAGKLVDVGMKKFTVLPVIDEEHEKAEITAQSIPEGLRVSRENVMDLTVATDGGEILILVGDRELTIYGTEPVTVDYDTLPAAGSGNNGPAEITAGYILSKLGLAGHRASEVNELYMYGKSVRAERLDAYYMFRNDRNEVYLPAEKSWYAVEHVEGLDKLEAFTNLTSLALVGVGLSSLDALGGQEALERLDVSANRGIDLSGLYRFPKLTELNIAWTDFGNVELLAALPALKTVYADSSMRGNFAEAGDLPFEVIYLDTYVTTREELLAALEDEGVYCIYIDGNLVLREEYELTVRADVYVTGLQSRVMNSGTLSIYGSWSMGMTDFENLGTVYIKNGGSYVGGMGGTQNYGHFIVESGGFHSLERGQRFRQFDGLYQNDGVAVLYNGGNLSWTGGRIVNHGTFMLEFTGRGATYAKDVDIDFANIEGDPITECSMEELEVFLDQLEGED